MRRKGESIQAYRKRRARMAEQGKKNTKKIKAATKKTVNKVKDKLGVPRTKVKTKAGDYPVYGKDSKKAKSFRAAYAASEGTKTFTWEGKKYKSKGADKLKSGLMKDKSTVTNATSTGTKRKEDSGNAFIKTKLGKDVRKKKKKNFVDQATPKQLKDKSGKNITSADLVSSVKNKNDKKETVAQRNRRLRLERNRRRRNK